MAEEVGVDPNTGTSRTNRFQDGVASRRNSSSIFGGLGWTQTNDGRVAAYCLSQLSYETIAQDLSYLAHCTFGACCAILRPISSLTERTLLPIVDSPPIRFRLQGSYTFYVAASTTAGSEGET